jgi:hypothetical protein
LAQELIPRQEYEMLLGALKERIRSAQLEALRSVNREQISLYADIGRMIVERTLALSGSELLCGCVWIFE